MSVCLFAIGRERVDLRVKQKLPSHVKFPGADYRLIFNSLYFVVFEKYEKTGSSK